MENKIYHNWTLREFKNCGHINEYKCENCTEVRIADESGIAYLPQNEECSRVHLKD